MTLRSFIDDVGSHDRRIAVLNDDASGPLDRMLADTFENQPIDVESGVTIPPDSDLPPEIDAALESDGDTALLFEDGRPVAASPMLELYDAILAINSDLFITGARGVGEIELPAVLANLDETRLQLCGYPLSDKEKLLLILVSRFIEQRAWAAGSGTLRSAFQRLSRIGDEIGTRDVYTEIADTDVDTHVYGIDDGTTVDLDVTVHTGTSEEYRDGWFVVYEPDDAAASAEDPISDPIALVCLETERRIWDGFWTYDPDRVAAIGDYIDREL
ncbi:DICT sensory domain-containing protein [Natrinema salsiterrestre]|uniref:Histidine kinase n=1 Tax=Natrinema salsiterrestre TaxID=2950540 RepID=A0A9Q4KZ35_9EURY|nr:histidine kinase [Natrinema salsiterrestre]MDF9744124.1 histidine kinase [Natrinema salsiterrestre]